ncbi:hypothetical protein AL544_019135 [Vibrio mimicus]|uniref:Uncharacterized protein n=1 Tax=Vibrio mimicus TaxID=674 RepID=A0A1D8SBX5_VIBMI|nr:hypothetical protein AL543_15040 [Vibrio mimicus]EMB50065.1 hypothetical protein D908_09761 [Vibrio mimicus CAIM 602]ERM58588.1 hypothetical protein P780_05585 [Vibrio mimicus CAIM 1882]ERM59431.1 hypothetical protein P781_05595 [Vibrio mimicus CAIM 1883]AOW82864.1 hypothetical protein VM_09125 [Vibrio mimicus]
MFFPFDSIGKTDDLFEESLSFYKRFSIAVVMEEIETVQLRCEFVQELAVYLWLISASCTWSNKFPHFERKLDSVWRMRTLEGACFSL